MDKISALMDDELDAQQAQQQFARIKQDPALAESWHTFHLIGDSLRGERTLSSDFTQRLSARLTQEPTVLAPQRSMTKRFTTYALSAAASLSAIAVVGWLAFFNNPLAQQTEIAQSSPNASVPASVAPVSAQLASVPSDGKMNEYLIAHQEFSPSTAIQGLAPYIRGVSSAQTVQGR